MATPSVSSSTVPFAPSTLNVCSLKGEKMKTRKQGHSEMFYPNVIMPSNNSSGYELISVITLWNPSKSSTLTLSLPPSP